MRQLFSQVYLQIRNPQIDTLRFLSLARNSPSLLVKLVPKSFKHFAPHASKSCASGQTESTAAWPQDAEPFCRPPAAAPGPVFRGPEKSKISTSGLSLGEVLQLDVYFLEGLRLNWRNFLEGNLFEEFEKYYGLPGTQSEIRSKQLRVSAGLASFLPLPSAPASAWGPALPPGKRNHLASNLLT